MNFSYKIYGFFILVFVASVAFVMKPPQKHSNFFVDDKKEVATLEINDFELFHVDANRLSMVIRGAVALQYPYKEEIYSFSITRYNPKDGSEENISSSKTTRLNDVFVFEDKLEYKKVGGFYFFTQSGIYDHKNGVFNGKGDFLLENIQGTLSGQDIFYNSNTQEIGANFPVGKIELRSK